MLTRKQKYNIILLSSGTFLEYFDLMLYVHMGILLNELFFPKADPFTESLYQAISFCSTFVFRPIGALLFGWIADNKGRKSTIILTTTLMALSSIMMFFMPTYAQIGIAASWLVTICRILQGMSAMAEVVAAQVYLSETIKPPAQYMAVACIGWFSIVGTMTALGVAKIFTSNDSINWRISFLFGSSIAIIGVLARLRLSETTEFINAKNNRNTEIQEIKADKRVLIAYFFMENSWPVWFYIVYMYFGELLKSVVNMSPQQVISHNFYLSVIQLLERGIMLCLCLRVYPLKILQVRFFLFALFMPLCLYVFDTRIISFSSIFIIQLFIILLNPTKYPATSIFLQYFPVLRRFTQASFLYALSRAIMYLISSFGAVYAKKYFGDYGIFGIAIIVLATYYYGLNVFIKLEKEKGNYI